MKQSCMSGFFASMVSKSHETQRPSRLPFAQNPRGLDRRHVPCKGAYMEAKEQKSHTRSDIFG